MPRSLTLILTSALALSACIARDATPDDDPTDAGPTNDANIDPDRGPNPDLPDGNLDAWVPFDAGGRDALVVPDAGRDQICPRQRTPADCAAADCTWRGDACVELAECEAVGNLGNCWRAECVLASGDRCVEPDDPTRCVDTDDPTWCARRQCFWRRAQDEDGVGCHPDPAPSLQDCAQPDAGTCEAAGCEWTGVGCAPPNQTPCSQLEDAVCGNRRECTLVEAGCVVDPTAACDGLAMDDCSARPDCGVQGLVCVDLPQDPCPQTPQWVCEQRPDCEAVRPDCSDAPKGGSNGEGEGGAGGGGGFICESRDDCLDDQGCVNGECVGCDRFLGCMDR